MKVLIAIMAFCIMGITGFAQEHHDAGEKGKWAELEAFHGVISQTFHPSEEGNLAPLKRRSGELVEKAQKLAGTQPPQSYNSDAIKRAQTELLAACKKVHASVQKKESDAVLTKEINEVHDVFHKIAGLCRKD